MADDGWEAAPTAAAAASDGWEAAPAAPPKRWDPKDVTRSVGAAVEQVGSDLSAFDPKAVAAEEKRRIERHAGEPWYQRFPAEFGESLADDASRLGRAVRTPFDMLGVPASAGVGILHGTLGSLLSYLPGVTKQQADEGIDQALLGLRPKGVSTARGELPPPAGLREAQANPPVTPAPAQPKPFIPEDPAADYGPRSKTGPSTLPAGYDPVTGIDQTQSGKGSLPGRYDPATDPSRAPPQRQGRSFWERLTGVGEPPMPATDPRLAASRLAIARADRGGVPEGYDVMRDFHSTDKGALSRDVDFRRDVERPPKTGQVQIPETHDPATLIDTPSGLRPGATPMAKRAITEDGLVLPPHMASETPPLAATTAASAGGKLKTEQMASVKNEMAIDKLAAKAAGLPPGTEMSEGALMRAKAPHDAAYQLVQDKVPETSLTYIDRSNPAAPVKKVDQIFTEASQLGEVDGETSAHFQHSAVPPSVRQFQRKFAADLAQSETKPTGAVMGLIRSYRAQAARALRSPNASPSDQWLALAQRKAADALEGLIERNLVRLESEQRYDPRLRTVEGQRGSFYVNKPDAELGGVMKAWRDARVALAKIHMVEDALNPATGHVRTAWIARQLQKGAPLTDELRRIGEYGMAYPKALRESTKFGGAESHSALDYFSSLLSLAHGNPLLAGAVWGRKAARSYALSPGAQRSLVTPRQPIGPVPGLGIMDQGQSPTSPDPGGILQAIGLR